MSFMKGFGDAFSQSFNQAQREKAAEREDMFRMTYQEFIRKNEKRDELKREDTLLANKAKGLVESYGQIPKEAWVKVHSWLRSGMDEDTIKQNLANGKWGVKQMAGEKQVVNEASAAPMGVDQQMQDAGMATSDANTASDNPITGFFDRMRANRTQKNYDYTLEKIGRGTGRTPEEVSQVLASSTELDPIDDSGIEFTPGAPERKPDKFASLNEAMIEQEQARSALEQNPSDESAVERVRVAEERVNALKQSETYQANRKLGLPGEGNLTLATVWQNGQYVGNAQVKETSDGWVDKSGNPIEGEVQLMSQEEKDDRQKVSQSLSEARAKFDPKRANVLASIRAVNTMRELVESTNGDVLAPVTTGVLQTAQKWIQDGITAAKVVQEGAAKGELPDQEYKYYLEQVRDRLLSEKGDDLATKRGLFETQQALLAYYLAGSVEQGGSKLSESERSLFMQMSSGGTNPDKFAGNMSNILVNAVKNLDTEGRHIYDGSQSAKNFEEIYGYRPNEMSYTSIEQELSNSGDAELQAGWKYLTGNYNGPSIPSAPSTTEASDEAVTYPTPNPAHIKALQENPQAAAEFDKKFGRGAAQRVLGGK